MKISTTWMLVSAGLALLANGCATASPPSALLLARVAMDQTSDSPAALLAPSYVSDARQSLDQANREFAANGDTGTCRDYAYITENKVEVAQSVARAELARQALDDKSGQQAQGSSAVAGPVAIAAR
jgi:hypothetical protein